MIRIFGMALVGLALASTARAAGDGIDELKRQFDYDPKEALDAKETLLYEREGAKVYDASGLNRGDIVQFALQGDATGLATGRYDWQIDVSSTGGTSRARRA